MFFFSDDKRNKQVSMDKANIIHKWIVLDGAMNTGWADNMNTLLGSDKTLCLPSGQTIKLKSKCTHYTKFSRSLPRASVCIPLAYTCWSKCELLGLHIDLLEQTNSGSRPLNKGASASSNGKLINLLHVGIIINNFAML